MLDAEEYLHLAINATKTNEHHSALEYLHKSLELEPDNAGAIFLMAAEHAELGLYDRAIEGMQKALEIAPDLEMARYQLGLLFMQQGRIDESKDVWDYLSENADDKAIEILAKGLMKLDEESKEGLDLIREATETETSNAFLRESINKIYDNLTQSEAPTKADKESSDPVHSLFLNAYNDSKFNKDDN